MIPLFFFFFFEIFGPTGGVGNKTVGGKHFAGGFFKKNSKNRKWVAVIKMVMGDGEPPMKLNFVIKFLGGCESTN